MQVMVDMVLEYETISHPLRRMLKHRKVDVMVVVSCSLFVWLVSDRAGRVCITGFAEDGRANKKSERYNKLKYPFRRY